MGITGASQNSYTMDADTVLHADGSVTATGVGLVATVARQLDFGSTTPQGVEQVAYMKFDLVIDVTSQEVASTDEDYKLIFQLANGTDFTAATAVHDRALLQLGYVAVGTNADVWAATDVGRIVIGVDNEMFGTIYRYARLIYIVAGTIDTTGLVFTAFLSRLT